ncbi:MAG: HD domain-containing protein [Candidatus Hydrogenedentes bacterium]|nr:HD domain-containing protein [Candidatus Hydrogenedentota bacterium]
MTPAPTGMDGEKADTGSYVSIHTDSLRMDTSPPFALYIRPGADKPHVLYCERKTRFTRDAKRRLLQNRIDQLYISEKERRLYSRYVADNLADILGDPKLTVREKSSILYDSAQAVVEEVLKKPTERTRIERGKAIVERTVEFMRSEEFLLEHLLRTISCDYYLYTHSVNVVAYSIALCMRAGYGDPATLREVANGALLHDVGESQLDQATIHKKGALTDEEWQQVKGHPEAGCVLLRKAGNLGEIALDIVLHHHEKLNGVGYPHSLSGDDISVFVRIVTIADIFDALTTERHHQQARSSFDALKLMGESMRDELDTDLFRHFVSMMGAGVRR